MSLIRPNDWLDPGSPLPTFGDLHRDIENLSRAVLGGSRSGSTDLFVPVDVLSRGNDMVVCAEVPGMNPDDIEVNVANGSLTITGERRQEDKQESDRYYRVERRYGSFFRSVPLPSGVDENSIEAKYSDGVLEVVVPGAAGESPGGKKIPVQIGGRIKKALGSRKR